MNNLKYRTIRYFINVKPDNNSKKLLGKAKSDSRVLKRFLLYFVLFVSSIGATNFYKKLLFSTANPYFWLRDANEQMTPDSDMTITHDVKIRLAIYVDVLAIHGDRSSEGYSIQDMQEL